MPTNEYPGLRLDEGVFRVPNEYPGLRLDEGVFRVPPMETETATCDLCGAAFYMVTADQTACALCARRSQAARDTRATGGRRFGIEIEVEWDDGYGCYDGCGDCMNCEEGYPCEVGGGNVPDRETIAAAISAAGVPCATYRSDAGDSDWDIRSDGSLSCGWEIVSPPIQWSDADQVRTVCRVLREFGAEPTDRCGLHVHHDVGDIDLDGMKRLLSRWHDWQDHTDRLCARYRADGEWCARYAQHQLDWFEANANRISDICYDADRYHSLNVSCFLNYGTVEIRQHESTLDPEEILAWVAYGQAVIDAALAGPIDSQIDNVDALIDVLPIRDYSDDTGPQLSLIRTTVRDQLKSKAARRARW